MAEPLLSVRDLRVAFRTEAGTLVRALHGVSFEMAEGETLALVGESGCGKTVTALSVLRLLPSPPAIREGGRIRLGGRDLLSLPEEAMREVRGREISMVFQEPMTSLNPVIPVGEQVAETFTAHGVCGPREARERAVEWLRRVRMPDPDRRAREYPHQMSGGMRQRAMIATALALSPRLLIADEPTTALDVTIQAQILALLRELREAHRMAVLLITHDLGVVHEFAERTAIMYLGRVVETGATRDLFAEPLHPYTEGLLASIPGRGEPSARLPSIPGSVPPLDAAPPGCPFADRCPLRARARERFAAGLEPEDRLAACDSADPPLEEYAPGHLAACHDRRARRKGGGS